MKRHPSRVAVFLPLFQTSVCVIFSVLLIFVLFACEQRSSAISDEEAQVLLMVLGLKEETRNPDSFAVEQATLTEAKDLCVTYQRQNGFGRMTRDRAVITLDQNHGYLDSDPGFDKAWNIECAKGGRDMTKFVQGNLKYNYTMG